MLINAEVFARKIIRPFGDFTEEDIDNEARTLSNLCVGRRSQGVVEVIRHGWFSEGPSYYYIDMEYCPETLDNRILESVKVAETVALEATSVM